MKVIQNIFKEELEKQQKEHREFDQSKLYNKSDRCKLTIFYWKRKIWGKKYVI